MRGIGYFFWRGAIAGILLGAVYAIILFVPSSPADMVGENFAAGAVLGSVYGAIIGLVTSLNTGLIVGMMTGITTERLTLIITGMILPAASVLASVAFLFEGPIFDPFILGIAGLLSLVNGGITWMFHNHYTDEWTAEAAEAAKSRKGRKRQR